MFFSLTSLFAWLLHLKHQISRIFSKLNRSVSIPIRRERFLHRSLSRSGKNKFKRLNTHHFSSLVTNEARDIWAKKEEESPCAVLSCAVCCVNSRNGFFIIFFFPSSLLQVLFFCTMAVSLLALSCSKIDRLTHSKHNECVSNRRKMILVNCRFSSVHYTQASSLRMVERYAHYTTQRLCEVSSLAFLITLRVHFKMNSKTGYGGREVMTSRTKRREQANWLSLAQTANNNSNIPTKPSWSVRFWFFWPKEERTFFFLRQKKNITCKTMGSSLI